jgi:hypothetical protein
MVMQKNNTGKPPMNLKIYIFPHPTLFISRVPSTYKLHIMRLQVQAVLVEARDKQFLHQVSQQFMPFRIS